MPFMPKWEHPIRIPASISLPHASPEVAVAGDLGTWQLPFQLARDVGPTESLHLQVVGGRNNKGLFNGLQTDSPDKEGWVTAHTADGAMVALTPLSLPGHLKQYGIFAVRLPAAGLMAGSVLTVTIGDRSGGGPGVRAPGGCLRNKFFILYVSDPGNPGEAATWTEANAHQIVGACLMHIVGGPAVRLYAYAPSQAESATPFAIAVRPQDRYDNLASTPLGDITVYLNDKPLDGAVEALPDTTAVRIRVAVVPEGVHRLRVEDRAAGLHAMTNPIVCRKTPPDRNVYWGMIHGHSEISDGSGTLDNYFRQLRDECALDFGAPGDHDHLWETPDAYWRHTCAKVRDYHEPGRFVTFPGYEFAKWRRKGEGDRNVYYLHDDRPIYRSDEGHHPWPNDLFKAILNETCLVIPHHTALAPAYCDWKDHDPVHERLVEIFQVRGSYECSEEDGNPLPENAYGEPPNPAGYVRRALALGWRVGFTAGGDDHSGQAGTDAGKPPSVKAGYYKAGNMSVLATARTREAIWDALWNRRVVATSGPRMLLNYTLQDRPMGSELSLRHLPDLRRERRLTVTFHGMAPVRQMDIIRNNTPVFTATGGGLDMEWTWTDTEPLLFLRGAPHHPEPFAFYYVRVIQADNETAWASPIWIDGA
ncbi:MAG: DUF3604 domain-containing protein [Lentisphaerae bacterium]|nr:DUF3604 domain-containing protein [Lentisphaerota bacterium]